jgi:hypothetical protein
LTIRNRFLSAHHELIRSRTFSERYGRFDPLGTSLDNHGTFLPGLRLPQHVHQIVDVANLVSDQLDNTITTLQPGNIGRPAGTNSSK